MNGSIIRGKNPDDIINFFYVNKNDEFIGCLIECDNFKGSSNIFFLAKYNNLIIIIHDKNLITHELFIVKVHINFLSISFKFIGFKLC